MDNGEKQCLMFGVIIKCLILVDILNSNKNYHYKKQNKSILTEVNKLLYYLICLNNVNVVNL